MMNKKAAGLSLYQCGNASRLKAQESACRKADSSPTIVCYWSNEFLWIVISTEMSGREKSIGFADERTWSEIKSSTVTTAESTEAAGVSIYWIA